MNPKTVTWLTRFVLLMFLGVAAFFLWTEHRAHLYGLLPYALILACPLMHLFLHHGHRGGPEGHGSHSEATGKEDAHAPV